MDFDRAALKGAESAGEEKVGGSRYNFFHMAFSIGMSIGTFVTYVIPTNIKARLVRQEGVGWRCFRALVPARDAFPRASFTPAAPKTDARSSFVNFPRQELRQPDKAPSVWPSRSATLHGKGENKTERGKSVSMDRYVSTFRRSTLSTQGIDDAFRVKHVCRYRDYEFVQQTNRSSPFRSKNILCSGRNSAERRLQRSARVSESRVRSGITLLPKSTNN